MDPEEKEIEMKMIKTVMQMPESVRGRFKMLHMLSDKRSKLNEEFNDACKRLEEKINAKKKPFLEQRRKIVAGELTEFGHLIPRFDENLLVLDKKVASIVKSCTEPEEEAKKEPTDTKYLIGRNGVPDFWVRAMKNNKLMWDQVKERDKELIEKLRHVETVSGQDEKK